MINGGIYQLLWNSQSVTTESAAVQPGQKLCTVTCGGLFPGWLLVVWSFLFFLSWGCDQSANTAPWDPSLHLTPADLSLFVTALMLQHSCIETGSPTHADTLRLDRGHLSLAANTSNPLPAVHNDSLNYFLKTLSVPPLFSLSISPFFTHAIFYIHTHRHCNTFVSVSASGQCFTLPFLFCKCSSAKKSN